MSARKSVYQVDGAAAAAKKPPPAATFQLIVSAKGGELYSDFELTTFGPVEWDLAALGPACEAAYNAAAERRGLRRLDGGVLRVVNAVGMSRAVACLALAPQLPMLVDALQPAVEQWRTMPFAGGLGG
ncbi:hypothetical protein AB0E64_25140 [Streptomyces caelestis]|uniref:Uncharacterized protein n=1 Tax=Streptomyces caelestis TaxID=36816 RepID=A0A7W9GZU2_9ACTN|nr:hypothetical protein [Streptomyces caelestis]MBB5793072.1 hypothetical protein [Streptomyces caelestis]